MTAREQWLASRRKGIGGTDASAILGFSPWRTPMDVWLDKTGRTDVEPEVIDPDRKFLLDLGTEMEKGIARLYTIKTGRELEPIPENALMWHRKFPILVGTPDRLVVGESRGVEIKTENSFQRKFGDLGEPDAIPEHYEIQCRHYMAITDRDVWDIPVLKGAAKLDVHTIERDLELEELMISQLLEWWDKHVLADEPPPIDGSDSWKFHLTRQYKANIRPIAPGNEVAAEWIRKRELAKAQEEHWSGAKSYAENQLRAIIGEHDGIEGDFGRVTWKKTRDSKETDFEAAFAEARDRVLKSAEAEKRPELLVELNDLFDSVLAEFTRTKAGYRRFHFSLKEKKQIELAPASEGGTLVDTSSPAT
jgi:putative phage-type endonuclease